MTAIVGILNRHAIAIAADSAETIGRGVKIYNKANKIFALSKYHPVGIAIYSNANFNSCIPWETVIKMYRNKLGKKSFATVKEYEKDFYQYIESYYRQQFLTQREEDKVFTQNLFNFWITSIVRKLPNSNRMNGIISPIDIPRLEIELNNYNNLCSKLPVIEAYKTVSKEQFSGYVSSLLRIALSQIKLNASEMEMLNNLIIDTLYNICLKRIDLVASYSGIAIFGYGEKEIFPCLCHSRIFDIFSSVLYYEEIEINKVSNNTNAYICPMAQTDVILSYITGISPDVEQTFVAASMEAINDILGSVRQQLELINPSLASAFSKIDVTPVKKKYIKKLSDFKQKSIVKPLIDTVATMEKEDLAELAENLIYLTSLKRRITPNLESVGGPIDVAVISKGDGFIWIKRKHYFNPDLNRSYFNNYLNDTIEINKDIDKTTAPEK